MVSSILVVYSLLYTDISLYFLQFDVGERFHLFFLNSE